MDIRLSDTRNARIEQSGILVSIAPNPTTDNVTVSIKGTNARADIRLINGQGQVVRQWSGVNAGNTAATLNVQGLTAGIYVLDILVDKNKITHKLIINSSR